MILVGLSSGKLGAQGPKKKGNKERKKALRALNCNHPGLKIKESFCNEKIWLTNHAWLGTTYLLEHLSAEYQDLNSMDFQHRKKLKPTRLCPFGYERTGEIHTRFGWYFKFSLDPKTSVEMLGENFSMYFNILGLHTKKMVFCFEEVSRFKTCLEGMASNFHQSVSSHQL